MSALDCVVSQDTREGNLGLKTDQNAGRSVLPPNSRSLNVDEKLQLSNENFKKSIDDFFKYKNITPLSQLTETPAFPTPHVLAQFASKAYTDYKTGESEAQYETRLDLPDGWKLLTTASNNRNKNGYFGAAYWHPDQQQIVIAHRGLVLKNLGALLTDVNGVLHNHYVPQMESAITFAHNVVEEVQAISRKSGVSFQLFYTGHSLGGWLAQITTFTTEYLKKEKKVFLKSNDDKDCYHPHTVVFDSPGCKNMLSKMVDKFDVRLDGRSIDLEQLDITSYLSAPNRINACNKHVGTVYRIFVDVADTRSLKKPTALYNLKTHSIDKIVEAFDPITGQVYKDVEGLPKVQVVIDWPIIAGLKGSEQYKSFFEWAWHLNNYHSGIKQEVFQLEGYHPIIYQTEPYDKRVRNLSVFSQQEQQFLQDYGRLRHLPELFEPEEIFSSMTNNHSQEEAEKVLQNFEIENQKVRCPDVNKLQNLIPYVKRLLQLFPQIKENTKRALSSHEAINKFYQLQTRRYLEQINQSPLHFKPDAMSLSEILRRDQHQVILLQINDGDEWTGLIMVYQVLQKNNCLCEGQYIILTLKCLFMVSHLMNLNKLMLSIETPYLLLMACENNQLLNDEEEILRTFFNTIKQKPNIKTFLITQSRNGSITFLQKIGRETFGDKFVTRNKHLTLSDITRSSQEKILEKSVSFQGSKISLNKLVPTSSTLGKFLPLGALLEGKQLAICEPMPTSNKYSEDYYIGRTLRYQKAIKQDIYNDKAVKDKHVILACAEQEFKQLCQQYSNSSVHWLDKDKSGKLVWQQSQGSLETLRKYIDTESSDLYTADDLDKLLEQAQHQRVMLISDAAGMGKSNVLKHLSKEIKKKFPTKWVVRIDLNDHTDALETLKQRKICERKAVDFVSKTLLKLEPGLEMELFKQCCEQKQKVRAVIMLDDFDEISQSYKDTVIDLLQALRQTEIEQLWVSTRPHLKEELEDKLQQLSYIVEPFSEENQVKFLRKLWFLNGWLTEPENVKEEEEEGRTSKELSQAGIDKNRDISGIPLQTRKSAKAIDAENDSYSKSVETVSLLPTNQTLLGLYEELVDRKHELYLEDKTGNRLRNDAAKSKKQHILECARVDHQLLALKMLFVEEQLAQLQIENHFTLSAECLTKIGIAKKSFEGTLQFIHPTFADYFVADFLVNQLTSGTHHSQNVQEFLLTNIFKEPSYRVIRYFIDGLLSKSKPSKEILKHYGNRMEEIRESCELIFYQAANEGNANIIGFCLESLEVGEHRDTINDLLLAQDNEGQTAWHLAARWGNIKVLEKLWDWALNKLTIEELKDKLFLAKDFSGNTAWNVAARTGNTEVLQKLWELAKEKLTQEDINNKFLLATDKWGSTVWHMVATKGQIDALRKIWEWSKENLTKEEIKNKMCLATDSSGWTVWHFAVEKGNLEVIEKLREWAEENLTKEEIKNEFLLSKDELGNTVWQMAALNDHLEVLQKIWEFAKENLTKEEIKNKMLLATDSSGWTVWHVAAEKGKVAVIEKIREWAEENLTKEEIKNELLLGTDEFGSTVWQMAALNGHLDVLQKIWDWAKENLTHEEIKKNFLLTTNEFGNTVWQMAALEGHLDLLQKIWAWAKENLTQEEIKNNLLLATDEFGDTVWHIAALEDHLNVVQNIWEWVKENLTKEEIKNNLLLATGSRRNTVSHVAAERGNLAVIQTLWEWAENNLTKEKIKNYLLLATDYRGWTVWHVAAESGNLEVIEKLWEWAEENLTKEEIKKRLLIATNNWGNTVWQMAALEGHLDVLRKIWEWAKENLTKGEIKNNFLLATDEFGNTVWQMAALNGHLDVLQKIWEWAKENLTQEEIKNNLLLATDELGNTVWQMAALDGHLDVLQKIWEWAKENLTQLEIKNNLLLATDELGNTVWQMAALDGHLDVLQKMWEWAKENLTQEEIKNNVLLATDELGNTVWQMAALNDHLDVLQKLWEWAKENLTKVEIKNNLLLATDELGNTVWKMAVQNGHLDFLQKIWEWAKENLTKGEIKNYFLLAVCYGGNTVWHVAAERGNIAVIEKLWEWAELNLTKEEIKNELLLATNELGNTVWHMAALESHLDVLQKIWEWAKGNLRKEEIKNNLLLATDYSGNTVWHIKSDRSNLAVLEKLREWAEENLTKKELKNISLLTKGSTGKTGWHVAAERSNIVVLRIQQEWAEENLIKEEIKNKLLTKNCVGKADGKMATKERKLVSLQRTWNWVNPRGLKKKCFSLKTSAKRRFCTWRQARQNRSTRRRMGLV